MKAKVVLFSAFHKPYIVPSANWIIPVHAGKDLAEIDLGFTGDNSGKHISLLNPFYCELTVLYWVWKNVDRSSCEYWGLTHYRRYMVPQNIWTRLGKRKAYHIPVDQALMDKYVCDSLSLKISKDLSVCDVIIPRIRKIERNEFVTVEEYYKRHHLALPWDTMIEVIKTKYPDYERSLIRFEQETMCYFNMMIASWEIWDRYLEWLFDILFEVSKRVNAIDDPYQRRFPGFLSERLLNLYIYHNDLKYKEYLTVNLE